MVSADRPLRCVVFEQDPDGPSVRAWLARMRADYDLRSLSTLKPLVTLGDQARQAPEHWRIYDFVPRSIRTDKENHVPMETSNNER